MAFVSLFTQTSIATGFLKSLRNQLVGYVFSNILPSWTLAIYKADHLNPGTYSFAAFNARRKPVASRAQQQARYDEKFERRSAIDAEGTLIEIVNFFFAWNWRFILLIACMQRLRNLKEDVQGFYVRGWIQKERKIHQNDSKSHCWPARISLYKNEHSF